MPIQPKAIHKLSEGELHMMGDACAVRWNVRKSTKTITVDGMDYKAQTYERSGKPYIGFYTVREDSKGEPWIDEDSPVDGGMGVEWAEQMHRELGLAIEYMKELQA